MLFGDPPGTSRPQEPPQASVGPRNMASADAYLTPAGFSSHGMKKQHRQKPMLFFGDPPGTRTPDLRLKRALLYQLS